MVLAGLLGGAKTGGSSSSSSRTSRASRAPRGSFSQRLTGASGVSLPALVRKASADFRPSTRDSLSSVSSSLSASSTSAAPATTITTITTTTTTTTTITSTPSPPLLLPPEYIADEAQLPPPADEAPDLRDLNNSLEALAAVFPDVQVDVFREMLTSFDGESRLALVADALLKNRVTWVKGRWRVAEKEEAEGKKAAAGSVATADRFRSPEYIKAAKTLACHEFMGLSRSTILAVLAEHNYAYLDARRALVQLSAKSWRFTLSSLFLRRKPVQEAGPSSSSSSSSSSSTSPENHPLVVWKSSGRGSILPTIKATGSVELDRELYAALVAPLRAAQRARQETDDRALAVSLNTAEAEAAGATYECACCFGTASFEELTTCSSGEAPHVVCFRCVQHAVREAVFGQGWARTIDRERGTLRCPAVDGDGCAGVVPVDLLHRALLDAPRGADVVQHLERRLAEHSLVGSGLPLVRCPFCAYAEVDDIYVPFHEAPLRVRVDSLYSLACLLLLCGVTPLLLVPLLVVAVAAALLPWLVAAWRTASQKKRVASRDRHTSHTSHTLGHSYLANQLAAAVARYRRRRRGQQFRCQNPGCGRVSCLGCGKAWTDIHVCHESALVALRTQVEQAMSMAIKRVCPRCHTSFVKTTGCNKLTCPCGYRMCYVCRKDISGTEGPDAGYRHFCDHFRPHGDGRPCAQCRRCNLWETEDTEAVLAAARAEAERRWRASERRSLSLAERAYLETGIAAAQPSPVHAAQKLVSSVCGSGGGGGSGGGSDGDDDNGLRWPTLAELLDWLLESILV